MDGAYEVLVLRQMIMNDVLVSIIDLQKTKNRPTNQSKGNKYMKTQNKPAIVFCHGIWADGSCFNKVIPPLQAEGYEVMAAQCAWSGYRRRFDVASVKATMGRVRGPVHLVGHSSAGSVITAAGTDERVAGLVFIAALAPDSDETSQGQLDKFVPTDRRVQTHRGSPADVSG